MVSGIIVASCYPLRHCSAEDSTGEVIYMMGFRRCKAPLTLAVGGAFAFVKKFSIMAVCVIIGALPSPNPWYGKGAWVYEYI